MNQNENQSKIMIDTTADGLTKEFVVHKKKMVAPVVITIVAIAYYIGYFVLLMAALKGILRILAGVMPIALIGIMLYVCKQRIQEIRSGEEDDLNQY